MATYQYRAKRGPEEATAGLVEAESRMDALEKLSSQGFFPLHIEEFHDAQESRWRLWNTIPRKDLGFFTRQLSDLLESHVPLLRALELTEEQTDHPRLKRLIEAIRDDIKGGASFSEALQKYPQVFPPLYISLIHAGEVGGMLSKTLDRLAGFMEQEDDFKSRIAAALAYPSLIAVVGGFTVLFLMIFVVPRLTAMFVDSGEGMPWMARGLSWLSSALTSYAGLSVFFFVIGGVGWMIYRIPQEVRSTLNQALYRVPVWGSVMTKSMLARFARTLAMLLAGGVPIIQALQVGSDVMGHPLFKEKIQTVAADITQGKTLSESLRKTALFPLFVCHMIAIGEEANTLEKALEKVAVTYDRETERAMKLATSLLEPVMILGVGSIIGVIVIGMLLPIFQISTFVK